jgi:RasGEF N-terminal motif
MLGSKMCSLTHIFSCVPLGVCCGVPVLAVCKLCVQAANYPSWESQRRLSIGDITGANSPTNRPTTVATLIEELVPNSEAGADYKLAEIVILTHRYFMSSEDLLSRLVQHFQKVAKDFKPKSSKKFKKKGPSSANGSLEVVLVRFLNILRKWLQDRYRCDFFGNAKLSKQFKDFCDEVGSARDQRVGIRFFPRARTVFAVVSREHCLLFSRSAVWICGVWDGSCTHLRAIVSTDEIAEFHSHHGNVWHTLTADGEATPSSGELPA